MLISWRQEQKMVTEFENADHASLGQCHPNKVAGGSTPPVVMSDTNQHMHDSNEPQHGGDRVTSNDNGDHTVTSDHVRWKDDDGHSTCAVHESTRTQHEHRHKKGVSTRRSLRKMTTTPRKGLDPNEAMARARVRAIKRAARRRRNAEDWKTVT